MPTGDAPTTSEWSTILLPTRLRLILQFDGICTCSWVVPSYIGSARLWPHHIPCCPARPNRPSRSGKEHSSWWRHQIEAFSALLALCAGNSPVTGEFLAQRPVTRSFDVFFDLRLNKQLSKQFVRLLVLKRHRAYCDIIVMFVQWCAHQRHNPYSGCYLLEKKFACPITKCIWQIFGI